MTESAPSKKSFGWTFFFFILILAFLGIALLQIGRLIETFNHASNAAQLEVLTSTDLPKVKPGDQVIIEGTLSRQNRSLQADYIYFCYQRNSEGDWLTQNTLSQPLYIDTPFDMLIHLSECPEANIEHVDNNHRNVGLYRDDRLTVYGSVSNNQPLTIEAEYIQVNGSVNDLRSDIRGARNFWLFWSFILIFMFYSGIKYPRKQSPNP